MSGKGSGRRPAQISRDEWDRNHQDTFPPKGRGAAARRIGQLEMPFDPMKTEYPPRHGR